MPSGYPLLVAAPLLGLATNLLAHLIGSRLIAKRNPIIPILFGFVVGLGAESAATAAVLAITEATGQDLWGYALFNLITYAALAFGYFSFVNLNLASLRIRVLREILASADGSLAEEAILQQYNAEHILDARLLRLTKWGQLLEREGRYFKGKTLFLILARFFDGLKLLVLGPRLDREAKQTDR